MFSFNPGIQLSFLTDRLWYVWFLYNYILILYKVIALILNIIAKYFIFIDSKGTPFKKRWVPSYLNL